MKPEDQLKAALNELHDSDGENVSVALSHLEPSQIEVLQSWDEQTWEEVVWSLYWLTPWKARAIGKLWDEKGDAIQAAIENELGTLREAA